MANTLDWFEIRTHHLETAAAFYEALFGWKITHKETAGGSDVWIFEMGSEPRIENLRRGGIWQRPEGEALGIVAYILVDDIEATLERVAPLGGRVSNSKMPIGSGYGAFFTDPDGNVIGLYQEKGDIEPAVG